MSTQQPTKEPLPGDYYGVVYQGGFLLPILTIVLVVGLWWFLRSADNKKQIG